MTRSTRLLLSLLLAIGVGMFVVAGLAGSDDGTEAALRNNPAIQSVSPGQGDQALQQSRVAVDLAPGYDGELVSIGGILIPSRAQSRTSPGGGQPGAAGTPGLPQGFVDGPMVWFQPGDEMSGAADVMDHLPLGDICAVARYWPVQSPDEVRTIDWCFSVT